MPQDTYIDVPSDVQPQPPTQALTVRDTVQAVERAAVPEKPAVTAAQAKIEAIADLTKSAYARASELQLTQEESDALQADFPDEAFKPGAAGKENLIYIEHAFLRDRLNKVFGIGRWAIIPRNRWAEDYSFVNKYNKTVEASRVYVEAMLLVRGCFCSESVGEMVYYKNNEGQNYADAVEGAKTAALRRCCKELGVGLQAWKKDWCEGWWQRHRAQTKPPAAPAQRIEHPRNQTPPAPQRQQSTTPEGEQVFPVCDVLMVAKKPGSRPRTDKQGNPMVDANGQPVIRHWNTYFIKFNDGYGEFEAITFDDKFGDIAIAADAEQSKVKLVTKPGKKAGSREIVSLERAEAPPVTPSSDQVPMNFDEHGNPLPEVMP